MSDPTLTKQELSKLKAQLAAANKLVKIAVKAGVNLPTPLTQALKKLETAVKTGKALGDAIDDTRKQMHKYQKDLKDTCKKILNKGAVVENGKIKILKSSQDQHMVCTAARDRLFMKDGASLLFNSKQDKSYWKNAQKQMEKAFSGFKKAFDFAEKALKAATR
ncbi:MAG: hypothetical protein AAF393_07080 [Pseudomonadota bacterium]